MLLEFPRPRKQKNTWSKNQQKYSSKYSYWLFEGRLCQRNNEPFHCIDIYQTQQQQKTRLEKIWSKNEHSQFPKQ